MVIAETAARKLLHGGGGAAAVARGVATGTLNFGLDNLWQLIAGFFTDIFASLFAALAGVAHLLVLPFEALWHLLVATVTGAAGAVSSGIGGLWHLVVGFFAALAGAAHELVLPLEKLWHLLVAAVAGAAGAISSGLSGLWQLIACFAPHLFAALAGAAHDLTPKLEAFWRWLQAAAVIALPYVLGVAAVLLFVALVLFCGQAICAVTIGICRGLVYAVCFLGRGLISVGAAAAGALSCLLPPCAECCAFVTMRAPGAAGMVISRAAFEASPALYYQILRAGGAVVATTCFCARPVASAVAAPIAFLFRTSVGA